jgi:hypothetical protein
MNNQQSLIGSANARQNSPAGQVNLFLFDLKNEADEHGFKADESWNVRIVTDDEITDLQKMNHLVICLKLQPTDLLNAYLQVKRRLEQSLSKDDIALTAEDLNRSEKRYLAAYPERSFRS